MMNQHMKLGLRRLLRIALLLVAARAATAQERPCPSVQEVSALQTARQCIQALAQARSTVGTCPQSLDVLRLLAVRLGEMGEYTSALQACTAVGKSGPLTGDIAIACARSHAARGHVQEARKLLSNHVAQAGKDPAAISQATLVAATQMEDVGRFAVAAEFLQAGIKAAPRDIALAERYVSNLVRSGKPGDAVNEAIAAAPRLGNNSELFLRKSLIAVVQQGDAPSATRLATFVTQQPGFGIEALDAVLGAAAMTNNDALAGTAAQRFVALSKDPAAAAREAVQALERRRFVEAARRLFEENVSQGVLTQARDRILLGRLQAQAGQFDAAEATFEQFLAKDRTGATLVAVAEAWMDVGKADRAVALLRPLEAGRDEDVLLALGRALRESGQPDEEFETYRRWAVASGREGAVWMRVGNTLSEIPDAARARQAFAEAARSGATPVDKAMAHAACAQSILVADRSALASAERELVSALDLAGKDMLVIATVEEVARLAPKGTHSLEAALMARMAEQDPTNTDLWRRLGMALVASGRGPEAVSAWKRHAETAPDRNAAVADGIAALFGGNFQREGLQLLRQTGANNLPSSLAGSVGSACLAVRDLPCARRYTKRFLEGPLVMEHDYLDLSERLRSAGLRSLAKAAAENAARSLPPKRQSDAAIMLGRLALGADRLDEAEKAFAKAAGEGGDRTAISLRIAREYHAAGRLDRAASWYGRARESNDGAVALQALSGWFDALDAQGRTAEIPQALSSQRWPSGRGGDIRPDVAMQMAGFGLVNPAIRLLEEALPSIASSQRGGVVGQMVTLQIRQQRFQDAFSIARAHCRGDRPLPETPCLAMAETFVRALKPDLASQILDDLVARPDAGTGAWLQRATLSFLAGDREAGLRSALVAVDRATTLSEVTSRMGPLLLGRGDADGYLQVLQRLAAREAFVADPALQLELGRAFLDAHRPDAALLSFQAHVTAQAGGIGTVYRDLVAAGRREAAMDLLTRANPADVGAIAWDDLRVIMRDLLLSGHLAAAQGLVARYREGHEEPATTEESLGRLYENLGWTREAIEAFDRVPVASLSPEGRLAMVRASLRLAEPHRAGAGANDALRAADGLWHSDKTRATLVLNLIDLLTSSGAVIEALELLDEMERNGGLSPALRLAQAALLAQSGHPQARSGARTAFEDAISRLDGWSDLAIGILRALSSDRSFGDWIGGLDRAGNGPYILASRLYAACMLGEGKVVDEVLGSLAGPADEPSLDGLLVAGRVLLACGNWAKAAEYAGKARRATPYGTIPLGAVRLEWTAGRMAGKEPALEPLLDALGQTMDGRALAEARSNLRLQTGDIPGFVAEWRSLARNWPGRASSWQGLLQAALWGGDESLRAEAERALLRNTQDPMDTITGLAAFYRNALRDDLAAPVLAPLDAAYPGDPSVMDRILQSALASGRPEIMGPAVDAALTAAQPSHTRVIELVRMAAEQLDIPTVAKHLPTVLTGPSSQASAAALLATARMWWRADQPGEAAKAVDDALRLAIDRTAVWSQLAQMVLTAPEVPLQALEQPLNKAPAKDAPEKLPYVIAARCLLPAATREAVTACLDRMKSNRFLETSILLATANKAMAIKKYELARYLFEAVLSMEPSRAVRALVAERVAGEVAAPANPRPADLASLAVFARDLLEPDERSVEPGMIAVHAGLTQLADDPQAAVQRIEAGTRKAPANPALRNHLAYTLSVTGLDYGRAHQEVAYALALADPDRFGAYLDTQAWALHLEGKVREALAIQEQSARFWQREPAEGLAECHLHLGAMLERLGRLPQAIEAYRRAVLLGPADPGGPEALQRWRMLANPAR